MIAVAPQVVQFSPHRSDGAGRLQVRTQQRESPASSSSPSTPTYSRNPSTPAVPTDPSGIPTSRCQSPSRVAGPSSPRSILACPPEARLIPWREAQRRLWDKLRQTGRTVEVLAVTWDHHHLDRSQRVLQARASRDAGAVATRAAGIRQAIAAVDWDTVEHRGGLNVVLEKVLQWEQENPSSDGREMIDDSRLRGSRTWHRMGGPLTTEEWRT